MKRKDMKKDLEIQTAAARYIRKELERIGELKRFLGKSGEKDFLGGALWNDYVGQERAYKNILERLATRDWEES